MSYSLDRLASEPVTYKIHIQKSELRYIWKLLCLGGSCPREGRAKTIDEARKLGREAKREMNALYRQNKYHKDVH